MSEGDTKNSLSKKTPHEQLRFVFDHFTKKAELIMEIETKELSKEKNGTYN